MKENAIILYNRLLHELRHRCMEIVEPAEQLQKSLNLCMDYRSELYTLVPDKGFSDIKEEVLFFKYIKPLFGREMEYRLRLYHAHIMRMDSVVLWQQEAERMEKILKVHLEFVSYYHEGSTHNDHAWFCQGQAPLPTTLCMMPWETDPKVTSTRDGWVSGLIAVERYRDELVSKIKSAANN